MTFCHGLTRARAQRRAAPISLVLHTALAVTLAGCASTSQRPVLTSGGTTTEISSATGQGKTISGDEAPSRATVLNAPVEQVWAALLVALPAIGVPVDVASSAAWTAGTQGTTAKGRFAGRRISTFLKCGGSAGVIEVADEHVVRLGALATLRPAAKGTELRVSVGGSARDPFTSVPARQCVSTGALEVQLDSAVRAQLR